MPLDDSDPKVLPRPIPETTKSGDEDTILIGKDDLVVRERKRLGDYLAYQTQKVWKNEYPIREGSELFTTRTSTGNPAPISDVDTNAVSTFIDTFDGDNGQKARAIFESTSESGLLDTDTKFTIKKGKSDSLAKTGTEIYHEINEMGGAAEVPQRIDNILFKNNRFSATKPAFVNGQSEGKGNSVGSLIVQPTLGAHAPRRFGNVVDGDGYTEISIDKLKTFGYRMMLEASGEYHVPSDISDPDSLLEAVAASQMPGLARIGQRVPVSRFDGVKLLNDVEPSFKKTIRDSSLGTKTIMSYGNVNSPLAPFNGLVATTSIASAKLLSLSIATILKSLYLAVDAIENASGKNKGSIFSDLNNSPSKNRRLRLGSYLGKRDDEAEIYRYYKTNISLDLVDTRYPYFECVNRGIDVFFSVDTNATISENVGSQASKMLENHGYYNVIFRNLIQSTSDLMLNLVKPVTNVLGAYDVDPNVGSVGNEALDMTSNAIGLIKIMNNSKALKFMNIIAMMGEASFLKEDAGIAVMDNILDIESKFETKTTPKLGVLHAKSRLSDTLGNRLAWGSNTIRSMYLLPSHVKTAALRYDGDDTRFAGMTYEKGFKTIDGNRFSSEDVKNMEDYLEADYMPFYFQDLRTNEIIAFHAFLENISDSFDVSYTETEGYGRIGKTMTYKNTDRNISISFLIAATNEDDFSDMWFKINKLITLLYPQYTQGRTLKFGEESFIQPFSQIISASPMIRMRIGDIIKSNYNKFALARLFGISSPDFHLESSSTRASQQANNAERLERLQQEITSINGRMSNFEWSSGDKVLLRANFTPSSGRGATPRQTTYQRKEGPNTPSARTQAQREQSRDLVLVSDTSVHVIATEGIQMPRGGGDGIEVRISSPVGEEQQGTFIVPKTALFADQTEVSRMAAARLGFDTDNSTENQMDRDAIHEFFADGGSSPNPIFKSFESVRGRGLAGFIKSLSYDVDNSAIWETTGLNNRAPKLMRFQLQFSPIHDLSPGLEHNGFNIAPLYNVGSVMKNMTRDGSQSELEAREQDYKTNSSLFTKRNK